MLIRYRPLRGSGDRLITIVLLARLPLAAGVAGEGIR